MLGGKKSKRKSKIVRKSNQKMRKYSRKKSRSHRKSKSNKKYSRKKSKIKGGKGALCNEPDNVLNPKLYCSIKKKLEKESMPKDNDGVLTHPDNQYKNIKDVEVNIVGKRKKIVIQEDGIKKNGSMSVLGLEENLVEEKNFLLKSFHIVDPV